MTQDPNAEQNPTAASADQSVPADQSQQTENTFSEDLGCAGCLGLMGLLGLLIPVIQLLVPAVEQPRGLNGWGWAGLAVGSVTLVGGGWYVADTVLREKARRQDQLKTAFFELVKENQGRVSLMAFAQRAAVDGRVARAFLDQQAIVFHGTFEVSEQGGVVYLFPH